MQELQRHLYQMKGLGYDPQINGLISFLYLHPEGEEHIIDIPGCRIEVYPY
jgi:hypothetical protein